jgi:hypothetical protein
VELVLALTGVRSVYRLLKRAWAKFRPQTTVHAT